MAIELSQKIDGMTGFIGRYGSERPTYAFADHSTTPPTYLQAQAQKDNSGGIVARVASPVGDLHGQVEFVGPEHYLDVDECHEKEIIGPGGRSVTLIFQHRAS